MSARYERVNGHDDVDSSVSPSEPTPPGIPNSPPPSFRSRASSRSSAWRQNSPLNPALADAFDAPDAPGDDDDDYDDDTSDGDADDRQRLMRSRDALRPMRAPQQANHNNNSASSASTSARTHTPSPTPASRVLATTGRVYGGGIQADGVFSNITARPEATEEKDEQPPTYEQAAADAAPPYWETTIMAPGLGGADDVFIDGLPVGSLFSFVWNGMISMSFQFVGFLLTYLLHSTHAAKNGSRAGLGITLIQYGFYMKGIGGNEASDAMAGSDGGDGSGSSGGYAIPPDPNTHSFDPGSVGKGSGGDGGGMGNSLAEIASSEWVSYALMIVGWFILIRAVSDFLRAKRHEQLVLQSPDRGLGVAVIAEGEDPEGVV